MLYLLCSFLAKANFHTDEADVPGTVTNWKVPGKLSNGFTNLSLQDIHCFFFKKKTGYCKIPPN